MITLKNILSSITNENLPNDLKESLSSSIERMYNNPPSEAVTVVLKSETSPDDVRRMLFNPSCEDMLLYPALMFCPYELQKEHPHQKVNLIAL
jgi:hypothetical protein